MATQTFNYTGSVQNWVVPDGVFSVTIECWGAQGGNNPNNVGGSGGYAKGTLAVTPGETLRAYVGGQGQASALTSTDLTSGGYNGGGGAYADGARGGGGGGASDVRQGGTALGNRKIVAAGGGGAGRSDGSAGSRGAHGGADTGEGPGGSQTSGGPAGTYFIESGLGWTARHAPTAGSSGSGGRGCSANSSSGGAITTVSGGGGGGGYYGGGGGGVEVEEVFGSVSLSGPHGGRGGSNYVGGVTSPTSTRGVRTGNGSIKFTYTVWEPVDKPVVSTSPAGPVITETNFPYIHAYTPALNASIPDFWTQHVIVVADVDVNTDEDESGQPLPATIAAAVWEQEFGSDQPSTSAANPEVFPQPHEFLPPAVPLDNGIYKAYVRFAKIAEGSPLWSEWGSVEFTIDAPAAPPHIFIDSDYDLYGHAIYVGSTPVDALYHGADKIWPATWSN